MTAAEQYYRDAPQRMTAVKKAAPDIPAAFGPMFRRLMKDGALTVREKELIALAVGMAIRCEPCIYAHTEKALQAGATRNEILDMAGVVVTMQGGPAYVYVPKLLDALDAFDRRHA